MSGAGAAGAGADADSSGAASRARFMMGIRWGGVDHIPRVQLDADITADSSPCAVRAALQKQRGVSCLPVGEPTSRCTSHTQPAIVVDASGNMVPYLGGFPLVYALNNDAWAPSRLEAFFEYRARCYEKHFKVPPRGPMQRDPTLNEMASLSAWAAPGSEPSNTAPVVIRCQSDVDLPDGLRWLAAPNVGRFWGMQLLQPTRSMAVAEFMAAVDSMCTVRPRYNLTLGAPYPRLESYATMPEDAKWERYDFVQVLALAIKALVVEHRLCDALRIFALDAAAESSRREFVRWWRECPATDAGTTARAFTVLQTRYWFAFDMLPAAMKPWDRTKATIRRHHGHRFGELPTRDLFELEEMWEKGKAEDVGLTDGCGCDTLALHSAAQHHTTTDARKLPAEAPGATPIEAPALLRYCTLCRKVQLLQDRASPTIALHLMLSAALYTLNDVVSAAKAELQLSKCGAPSKLLGLIQRRGRLVVGYDYGESATAEGLQKCLAETGVTSVGVPAASAAAVIKLAPSDDWRAVEAAVRKSRPMFRVSGDGFTVTVDEEQKPVEVVVPHHLGLKALPVPFGVRVALAGLTVMEAPNSVDVIQCAHEGCHNVTSTRAGRCYYHLCRDADDVV